MLIKGKKITMCGEDKLYFPEGCWTSCDSIPILSLTLEITSSSQYGNGYRVGETITYEATLTNLSENMANGIKVSDNFGTSFTSGKLGLNESQVFTFSHVVTDSDVEDGYLDISVYYDNKLGDTAQVTTYGYPLMHVYATQTPNTYSTPVRVGDTVTFTAYAENTGAVTLSDVTITNSLNDQSFNVGTLRVGEKSETITFTCQVPNDKSIIKTTETGLLYINIAIRANGLHPHGTTTPSTTNQRIYVEYGTDRLRFINVTYPPSSAPLGGTITYGAAIENNGTEPLDVTVSDALNNWEYHVGVMNPGDQTQKFERSYTIPLDEAASRINVSFGAVGSSLSIGPGTTIYSISHVDISQS